MAGRTPSISHAGPQAGAVSGAVPRAETATQAQMGVQARSDNLAIWEREQAAIVWAESLRFREMLRVGALHGAAVAQDIGLRK